MSYELIVQLTVEAHSPNIGNIYDSNTKNQWIQNISPYTIDNLYQIESVIPNLPKDSFLNIGRAPNSWIFLKDLSISAIHCQLCLFHIYNPQNELNCLVCYIIDQSTNGTFINNTRIPQNSPKRLNIKDIVSLGRIGKKKNSHIHSIQPIFSFSITSIIELNENSPYQLYKNSYNSNPSIDHSTYIPETPRIDNVVHIIPTICTSQYNTNFNHLQTPAPTTTRLSPFSLNMNPIHFPIQNQSPLHSHAYTARPNSTLKKTNNENGTSITSHYLTPRLPKRILEEKSPDYTPLNRIDYNLNEDQQKKTLIEWNDTIKKSLFVSNEIIQENKSFQDNISTSNIKCQNETEKDIKNNQYNETLWNMSKELNIPKDSIINKDHYNSKVNPSQDIKLSQYKENQIIENLNNEKNKLIESLDTIQIELNEIKLKWSETTDILKNCQGENERLRCKLNTSIQTEKELIDKNAYLQEQLHHSETAWKNFQESTNQQINQFKNQTSIYIEKIHTQTKCIEAQRTISLHLCRLLHNAFALANKAANPEEINECLQEMNICNLLKNELSESNKINAMEDIKYIPDEFLLNSRNNTRNLNKEEILIPIKDISQHIFEDNISHDLDNSLPISSSLSDYKDDQGYNINNYTILKRQKMSQYKFKNYLKMNELKDIPHKKHNINELSKNYASQPLIKTNSKNNWNIGYSCSPNIQSIYTISTDIPYKKLDHDKTYLSNNSTAPTLTSSY